MNVVLIDPAGTSMFTVRKRSCGRVMFLHLSVSHSVRGGAGGSAWQVSMHGGGIGGFRVVGGMCGGGMCGRVCMAGEHAWQGAYVTGGMHGRWHAWQGPCMVGGMHGRGHEWQGYEWQERRPLQGTVRILVGCILVLVIKKNACQ